MKLHLPNDAAAWFVGEIGDYVGFLNEPRILPLTEQRMSGRLIDAFGDGVKLVCEDPHTQMFSRPYDVPVRDALMMAVQRDPDPALRWLLIAWELMGGAHDFCRGELEILVVHDIANIVWIVSAASWVRYWSGQETTSYLRESMQRIDAHVIGFRAKLTTLSQVDDDFLCATSKAALEVLDGKELARDLGKMI